MSIVFAASLLLVSVGLNASQPALYTCQAKSGGSTVGTVQAASSDEAVSKYKMANPQYEGIWCIDAKGRAILERAARSNGDAERGVEIPEATKNQCVVAADPAAQRFIRNGKLDLQGWLAGAAEQKKLAAISCITAERETLKQAMRADFERCKPVLQRIAAGMSNERAMALAMQARCERYIIP